MPYTSQYTEVHDVLAVIAPNAVNDAVGAHVTGYVSIADYHRAFAFLQIGESTGAGTIDVSVQQATSAAGANTKALTTPAAGTKSPTTVVAGDAGNYIGIEMRSEEFDVTGGFVFVQVTVTVAVAVYVYSLQLLGIVSRYEAVGVTDFQEVVA